MKQFTRFERIRMGIAMTVGVGVGVPVGVFLSQHTPLGGILAVIASALVMGFLSP